MWIPNHNKISLDYRAEYARELFARPEARLQFHSYLGQCVLQTARTSGGYIGNLDYFNQWDMRWTAQTHPGRSLQSCFPPSEVALLKWCRLYFPSWVPHFWPEGPPVQKEQINLYSVD